MAIASRGEDRTAAFYRWEIAGRGWSTYAHTVPLEPPFLPFLGHGASRRVLIDDSHRPSLLASLFGRNSNKAAPAQDLPPQEREPPCLFEQDEPFAEFEVLVPLDEKIELSASTAWLQSIGAAQGPVSFELVGRDKTVSIRFAASDRDVSRIRDHLRTMFPRVVFRRAIQSTVDLWMDSADGVVGGKEMALLHEFMLPLNDPERGQDLFTPLLAVLGRLDESEVGILQVLFQPVESPWGANAINAVHTPSGEPFFEDGKDVTTLALQKCSEPLYATVIRAVVSAATRESAEDFIFGIGGVLAGTGNPSRNQLDARETTPLAELIHDVLTQQTHRSGMILSLSDLSLFVHLPSPTVRAECLLRPSTKSKAAPPHLDGPLVLGVNEHEGLQQTVGLAPDERLRHSYVIGASGTGKSTLLLSLISQDIEAGRGVSVLDPHGDLIEDVLARVPEERVNDVVLFDPSDEAFPVGFNILSAHSELERSLLSSDLVGVFRRLSTSFGDQMVTVLGNAILAFLESTEGGTLLDLRRFLLEKTFRDRFLETVQDAEVVMYWKREFPLLKGSPHAPILTRLNTFLRPKLIRYMVAQKNDRLNMRGLMDEKKILLAKLSQGAIGEENSHLLGSLLVAKLAQAAMSRQDADSTRRIPHFLYIDEFHHFITPSIASILSGARKYGLGLTLAHQEIRQLKSRNEDVASAVLANAYTRAVFRVGEHDAKALAEGLSFFESKDLQNLGIGEAIVRVERPEFDFNLRTLPAPNVEHELATRRRETVLTSSRASFARPREEIEKLLRQGYEDQKSVGTEMPIESSAKPRQSRVSRNKPVDVAAAPPSQSLPGRGGPQHKYLQSLVKRIAEDRGFDVHVEKMTLDGHGHIDVFMERVGVSIGCEITVTTRVDHEIGNLTKCLAAGCQYSVLLSSDPEVLDAASATYVGADRTRVRFLTINGLTEFLDNLDANLSPNAEILPSDKSARRIAADKSEFQPRRGIVRLTAKDAADYLGIAMQTLAKMRWNGTSPVFHKVGRQVVYDRAELDAWMEKRRRRSTSDPGPAT